MSVGIAEYRAPREGISWAVLATIGQRLSIPVGGVLLFCFVFFNEASFRIGDSTTLNVDAQMILRLLFVGACGLYGFLHVRGTMHDLLAFPYVWIVLFGIWSALTIPFAIQPMHALGATWALGCLILFVPAALRELGGMRVVSITAAALLVLILGCWLAHYLALNLYQPELTQDGEESSRLAGLTHPNTLGRAAAMLIALLLILGNRRCLGWRWLWPPLLFAVVTIIFTGSRTAALLALIAAAPMVVRSLGMGTVVVGGLLAAMLVMALLFADSVGWIRLSSQRVVAVVSRTGDAEDVYNLTGRIDLWRHVVERIGESPIMGYGFGSARFAIGEVDNWRPGHAHNLLLNVTLGSGMVGGLLLLAMFLSQILVGFRSPELFTNMILIWVLIGGLSEAVILGPTPDSCTLLWLVALYWRQCGADLASASTRPEAVN